MDTAAGVSTGSTDGLSRVALLQGSAVLCKLRTVKPDPSLHCDWHCLWDPALAAFPLPVSLGLVECASSTMLKLGCPSRACIFELSGLEEWWKFSFRCWPCGNIRKELVQTWITPHPSRAEELNDARRGRGLVPMTDRKPGLAWPCLKT